MRLCTRAHAHAALFQTCQSQPCVCMCGCDGALFYFLPLGKVTNCSCKEATQMANREGRAERLHQSPMATRHNQDHMWCTSLKVTIVNKTEKQQVGPGRGIWGKVRCVWWAAGLGAPQLPLQDSNKAVAGWGSWKGAGAAASGPRLRGKTREEFSAKASRRLPLFPSSPVSLCWC